MSVLSWPVLQVFRLHPPLDYRFLGSFASKSKRHDLLFTPINPRKHPAFYKDPFGYLDSQVRPPKIVL
jgi:hypothetical protein